jgi:hypothetical protein
MSRNDYPTNESSRQGYPAGSSRRRLVRGLHSASAVGSGFGTCVQEWTGTEWLVVDASDCPEGSECSPLDARQVAGEYTGQRVITRPTKKAE